jgi:cytochrome c-type biogenesis protein CcmE
MTPRRRRMLIVVFIVTGISSAAALALNAFRQNLLFFYSPTQVANGEAPPAHLIRVGGLVTKGSFKRDADGLTVHFVVTDTAHSVPVVYKGILPDLFREGQGIIAHGRLDKDGVFVASEVLAKHDENYMPPEVASALKTASASSAHVSGARP